MAARSSNECIGVFAECTEIEIRPTRKSTDPFLLFVGYELLCRLRLLVVAVDILDDYSQKHMDLNLYEVKMSAIPHISSPGFIPLHGIPWDTLRNFHATWGKI